MSATQPRYSKEEFARRGDDWYQRAIGPALEENHQGQYVAIDIESGNYEVDEDEVTAAERLTARIPDAQVWLARVGSRHVRRFGFRTNA